ncbi:MAG: DUF1659 domain-containing protein [Syntrophomonadaceae bacterium]|nr:DUF1659 domain-containing protein [Syntrophomonadaceae bacterium]
MAIQATTVASELVINIQDGVNAQGNPVIRARRYRNVKPTAAAQDVYAVGQSLAGLQDKPLTGIQRRDLVELESV